MTEQIDHYIVDLINKELNKLGEIQDKNFYIKIINNFLGDKDMLNVINRDLLLYIYIYKILDLLNKLEEQCKFDPIHTFNYIKDIKDLLYDEIDNMVQYELKLDNRISEILNKQISDYLILSKEEKKKKLDTAFDVISIKLENMNSTFYSSYIKLY